MWATKMRPLATGRLVLVTRLNDRMSLASHASGEWNAAQVEPILCDLGDRYRYGLHVGILHMQAPLEKDKLPALLTLLIRLDQLQRNRPTASEQVASSATSSENTMLITMRLLPNGTYAFALNQVGQSSWACNAHDCWPWNHEWRPVNNARLSCRFNARHHSRPRGCFLLRLRSQAYEAASGT
jgi:hypothetical protein